MRKRLRALLRSFKQKLPQAKKTERRKLIKLGKYKIMKDSKIRDYDRLQKQIKKLKLQAKGL